MKVIIRADDLGYSEAINYGIEKSITDGITTCVGTMCNMEATKHGLKLLQPYDICIGVHTNICAGKPLCNINQVSSLVDCKTKEFYTSKEISARENDSIVKDEAKLEIQAQIDQFRLYTGRNPDYIDAHGIKSSTFYTALEEVAKENELFYVDVFNQKWYEKWGLHACDSHYTKKDGDYDPYAYFLQNQGGFIEKGCNLAIFHPGYLDQYILEHSSFTTIRVKETKALCSPEIKEWLVKNKVKLCSFKNFNENDQKGYDYGTCKR